MAKHLKRKTCLYSNDVTKPNLLTSRDPYVWYTLQITVSKQMILKGSKASRRSVSNAPVTRSFESEKCGKKIKMVRVCAYPGCFNQEKSVRLRQWASVQEESLTFHTLPLHDPERLKLWLIALHRETESLSQSLSLSSLSVDWGCAANIFHHLISV